MKLRKLFRIINIIQTMGWFPFMLLTVWTRANPHWIIFTVLVGFFVCYMGGLLGIKITLNEDLFKSIEELQEERRRYQKATEELERKTEAFIKMM